MPCKTFQDTFNESVQDVKSPIVYANDPAVNPEDWFNSLDLKRVSKEDAEAKANGTLIGRIVYAPFREGQGHMYQIADEHKRGVLLVHICGVLPLPRWGKRSWVLKANLYFPDNHEARHPDRLGSRY